VLLYEEKDNVEMEMPSLVDASDKCIKYHIEREVLGVKQAFKVRQYNQNLNNDNI
jgi:hypothetical protein